MTMVSMLSDTGGHEYVRGVRQWCLWCLTQGDVKLPSASQMWEDIRDKEAAMAKRYVKSQRHTIQVDYVNFMDELAELNGCKPDFGETLKECIFR